MSEPGTIQKFNNLGRCLKRVVIFAVQEGWSPEAFLFFLMLKSLIYISHMHSKDSSVGKPYAMLVQVLCDTSSTVDVKC